MRKPISGEARSRQVQLMQTQSIADIAKKRAEEEHISVNEWINRAVEDYISLNIDSKAERHTRRVQIFLTPTTYDALSDLAERNGRSVNQTVENAIRAYSSGPNYYDQAKYLNKKNDEIMSTLNNLLGGFTDITWKNAWEDIRSLQKDMSKPGKKKAEKEALQAQIDSKAEELLQEICKIRKEVNQANRDFGGFGPNQD